MSDSGPQVGDAFSRDKVFYNIVELQGTADGADLAVCDHPAPEGAPHSRLFVKTTDMKPAGAFAGIAIWGD